MRIRPDSVRIGANEAMMLRGGARRFANWQCRGRRNTQMIPVGGLPGSIQPTRPRFQESFARIVARPAASRAHRSEEHTSELQSLMRISYAVFCLIKNKSVDV